MNKFLSIDSIVFNYPLDLFASLLLFFFIVTFSLTLSDKKKIIKNKNLNFLFFYIATLALSSQILFLISFINYDYIIIRIFLWALILVFFSYYFKKVIMIYQICLGFFYRDKFLFILIFSFFLISLLPTIDADTLDYHLGFGVDIINNRVIQAREDWLHYRLAGSGEYLNLLGLTFGGRNFGQLLQFSSLLIFLISILTIEQNKVKDLKKKNLENQLNQLLFISPVIIVMMFSQKYQLFGSSVLFYLFTLIYFYFCNKNKAYLHLICLTLCFLVTLKHSYIITAGVISILLLFKIVKNNHLNSFLKFTMIGFFLLNMPFFLKNLYFYGDPISPLLEQFKLKPNYDIINFSQSIKIAEEKINILNLPLLILNFFIPLSKSNILHFFGLSAFTIFFILNHKSIKLKFFTHFIFFYFVLFVLIGHNSIRYYIDIIFISILFCKIYFLKFYKNFFFIKLLKISKIQSLVILFLNFIIFLFFIPKGFNPNSYAKILSNYAPYYDEIKWIEMNVPKGSIVISENVRSNSLFTRRFVSHDLIKYFNYNHNNYVDLIKKYNVEFVILDYPIKKKFNNLYKNCADLKTQKRAKFVLKTKNPLSKYKINYEMILFKNRC